MRIVLVIGVVLGSVVLASCASTGAYIGDNLPEWAGGLPKGTPPRAGSPGYDAYLRGISGDHTATTAPPAQPKSAAARPEGTGGPANSLSTAFEISPERP